MIISLTRREIIVLIISITMLLVSIAFPKLVTEDNEFIYLILVVIPLGIHIVTDRERCNSY
jgi:hypothetical protein